jgi:putative membrane protein
VKGIVISIAATAIAFAILVNILPAGIVHFGGGTVDLVILAVIAGIVNGFVKPVVKMLSFPISMMTLGLFGVLVNGAMLLIVAWGAEKLAKIPFTVGGFPTHGITADTIIGAVVAAVVLSIISTIVGLVVHD